MKKNCFNAYLSFAVLSIMSLTKTNKNHLLKVHGHFYAT